MGIVKKQTDNNNLQQVWQKNKTKNKQTKTAGF